MVSDVPRTRPAYPADFRRAAIELLRQGRTPGELSKGLGVAPQTLRNLRRQDQLDRHERDDGGTTDERAEPAREPAPAPGAPSAQASRGRLRDGERDPVTCYRIVLA